MWKPRRVLEGALGKLSRRFCCLLYLPLPQITSSPSADWPPQFFDPRVQNPSSSHVLSYSTSLQKRKLFQIPEKGDFPGSPAVTTLRFHRRGHRFLIPGRGTKIPHAAWPENKPIQSQIPEKGLWLAQLGSNFYPHLQSTVVTADGHTVQDSCRGLTAPTGAVLALG